MIIVAVIIYVLWDAFKWADNKDEERKNKKDL